MKLSEQAVAVLRETSLFAGFNQDQLAEVPKVAIPHEFAPGDFIVHEGDEGARSLWLVLEGEVEIRVGGQPLRVDGPGSHFGEMALLADAPRSADVVAVSAVTALQLSRAHLHGLIHANPDVAIAMLAELSRRLRRITEATSEILAASPEAASLARSRGIEAVSGTGGVPMGPIEWGLIFDT